MTGYAEEYGTYVCTDCGQQCMVRARRTPEYCLRSDYRDPRVVSWRYTGEW